MKTTHLLLNLCKSLYGSGKFIVLDSGFCVLKALIALKKVSVYAHAVIKKEDIGKNMCPGRISTNLCRIKVLVALIA